MSEEQATEQLLKPRLSFFELSIISVRNFPKRTSVVLGCDPSGGNHPRAAEACEQLSKVDGQIEKISGQPGACPEIYDPVIVVAAGIWNGKPRHYRGEYSNQCVAKNATGGVIFDFEGSME
jgi:hypothetical protein